MPCKLRTPCKTMVKSKERQFEASRHSNLIENMGQVPLHGFLADGETPGDFAVSATLGDQRDDLQFSRREAKIVARRIGAGTGRQFVKQLHHVRYHFAVEPILAIEDGPDGPYQ